MRYDKRSLQALLKKLFRAVFKWGGYGFLIGFVGGFIVPIIGPLNGLEPLAVPFLFGYFGMLAGIATLLLYRFVRWVYTE